jgi:hypothetical protein
VKKQKQDLIANDTWGSKKKNFYGRDKKRGDGESSDEEDD